MKNQIKAKVNTKSNYRNLNGQWLRVHEIIGTRISCIVKDEEVKDNELIVDFTLKEVTEMDTTCVESDIHPIFTDILKRFGMK